MIVSTSKHPAAPELSKYWGAFPYCLGERLNGIQEVSGSIPLISTKSREIYLISRLFLYFLRKKLLWSCSRRIQACLLDLLYFT